MGQRLLQLPNSFFTRSLTNAGGRRKIIFIDRLLSYYVVSLKVYVSSFLLVPVLCGKNNILFVRSYTIYSKSKAMGVVMSVIGGYYGGGRASCDGAALTEISRAMIMYGGERQAFIKGRIGLSVGLVRGENDSSGLYFLEKGSEVLAAVISGETRCIGPDGILREYSNRVCLDGAGLDGEFSAAVCDGRDELIILRRGELAPPLYYGVCGGDVAFASRVPGLFGFLGGCFVKRDILREHLTEAAGRYSATDLYCGVYAVERNTGLHFCPTGASCFSLRDPCGESLPTDEISCGGGLFLCPDTEELRDLLIEILTAFDYPQFDAFMPSFLRDMRSGGAVTDYSLCMDTRYSEERRERMFALCGRRARTVPPSAQDYGQRELKGMEDALRAMLEADSCGVYEAVLGRDWRGAIEKEKNTVRRIRIEGMLWQTAFWYERYNVSLI